MIENKEKSDELLLELLGEAIYCLELCRPILPKVYAAGSMHKSSLSARVESLIDHAYSELGDDLRFDAGYRKPDEMEQK